MTPHPCSASSPVAPSRHAAQLTSQEKNAGVMRAFKLAPHRVAGKTRRNHAGTCSAQAPAVQIWQWRLGTCKLLLSTQHHLGEARNDGIALLLCCFALHVTRPSRLQVRHVAI